MRCIFLYKIIQNFYIWIYNIYIYIISMRSVLNGRWFFEDINKIKIRILIEEEVEEYKGKIIPAWDWEENIPTLVFTAINKNGVALWGKKIYK